MSKFFLYRLNSMLRGCGLVFLFALLQGQVSADEQSAKAGNSAPSPAVENVMISVRTILASQQSGDDKGDIAKSHKKVAGELEDLRTKLEMLDYQKFQLLGTDQARVAIREKREIDLDRGHRLTVRPMYIERSGRKGNPEHRSGEMRHKVGMWLLWNDERGRTILDTMMHFKCGENLLTAVESPGRKGVMLAIRVDPEQKQVSR